MDNPKPMTTTEKARKIFDLMRGRPRSEVINVAVTLAGVKKNTASTQFDRWRKRQQGATGI